ncbi:MAG TPA: hydrogen peroxide-dependent heme synthase [Gemmatimonadaceae bacterium]|nr:hydrogen peroxide-dependent heme synthase [Gemmatimonadaceae bacterium]
MTASPNEHRVPPQDDVAVAHPPETLEGWYALHQLFSVDRAAARALGDGERAEVRESAVCALHEIARPAGGGWSAVVPLIGSVADVMLMHFRPALDELGSVQRRLSREPLFDLLRPVTSFLSVTEAGLYHITAKLAREAAARGGSVGDDAYREALAARVDAERDSAHIRRRLYPEPPPEMPYVCFYPMSKRRAPGQNWYALSLEERSRLMYAHGLTGRRYAGRVLQVISGAIGLDAWEWGVTLFAGDPLVFKKLVTDMRFDEVSAQYAEFGDFWVGKMADPAAWVGTV